MTPSELRAERDERIRRLHLEYRARIDAAVLNEKNERAAAEPDPMFEKKISLAEQAKELRSRGLSYAEIGRRIGRTPALAKLYTEIPRTDLPVRAANALCALTGGYEFTPKEVHNSVTIEALKALPNCGMSTIAMIQKWLEDSGYSLKP